MKFLFLILLFPAFSFGYVPNSVTSNGPKERTERATVACQGSSAITRQSGSWVSSIGNVSSGACAVTIASGIFTAAPTCTTSLDGPSAGFMYSVHPTVTSSTAMSVNCQYVQTGTTTVTNCTGNTIHIICHGPR